MAISGLAIPKNHIHGFLDKNNRVGEDPSSWSLLKLPVFGLYSKLLLQGSTFPLASPENAGLIVGKFREKVELLYLKLSPLSLPFSLFLFSLSPLPVWSKMGQVGVYSLPRVITPLVPLDYPYHLIHLLWISLQSCGDTCLTWPHLSSCLTCSVLDTWHNVSHLNHAKCSLLHLMSRKT